MCVCVFAGLCWCIITLCFYGNSDLFLFIFEWEEGISQSCPVACLFPVIGVALAVVWSCLCCCVCVLVLVIVVLQCLYGCVVMVVECSVAVLVYLSRDNTFFFV